MAAIKRPANAAAPPLPPQETPVETERDQISQNIEAVLEFYTREEQKISRSQRILERISNFIGQPVFLGFILLFVALWMLANDALRQFGMAEFDPPAATAAGASSPPWLPAFSPARPGNAPGSGSRGLVHN